MENSEVKKLSHKEWRKIAKKERRRKIRKKLAKERDEDEINLRKTLERSENYLKWIEEQANIEKENDKKQQEELEKQRKLWLENEIKSQEEFKLVQEKRMKARQERQKQDELMKKEFELKQASIKLKNDEIKRKNDEELERQNIIKNEITAYIDDGAKTPEILKAITDSQPSKEQCPFYTKTGACRYGDTCSRNHRKYALSNIIMIPGFYNHFSLEKNSNEYDTDVSLEYSINETQNDYNDFLTDILPEFELYGKIKTLKCCFNSGNHLRGNVYIEYYSKRDAARAWRNLNGRYYAGRQLNCQFIFFNSWNNAVCGITKCPKGRTCNFLHTFKNYNKHYDIKSPPRWLNKKEDTVDCSSNEKRSKPSWDDSIRSHKSDRDNWRWSESPDNHRSSSRSSHKSSSQRSHRSRSSRKHSRNSSRSENRDDSSSDDERISKYSKKHKHRDKENENNRSSSRSSSTSRHHKKLKTTNRKKSKRKKAKKSKWDERDKITTSSSSDEYNNDKNWDTTDSE